MLERRVWPLAAAVLASPVIIAFAGFRVGAYAVIPLLAGAVLLHRKANASLDEAFRWKRGARSETAVGLTLELLVADGYRVQHDVEQPGEGNVDHLVVGPGGTFLVETKTRSFRDAHLTKVKRQAAKLQRELGGWVTPVICLHERTARGPWLQDGVWIVPHEFLLGWMRARQTTR
jgi:hypothetical protein